MARWIAFVAICVLAGVGLALAQGPQAPATSTSQVPDWVLKYSLGQENAYRGCSIQLAQEQDKTEKLQKELAETKAALAKAAHPEPARPPEKK